MRTTKKRKINTARIRQTRSYDRREISKVLGVHKNTITLWVRQGLRPMDDQRPELFHGSEIVRFIKLRQQNRKQICADDEMYCLKCHAPRKAVLGSVSIETPNEKTANLVGKCSICEANINRRISLTKVAIFEKSFGIKKRQISHLIEPHFNRLNCANSEPELASETRTNKAPEINPKTTAKKPKYEQFNLFEN